MDRVSFDVMSGGRRLNRFRLESFGEAYALAKECVRYEVDSCAVVERDGRGNIVRVRARLGDCSPTYSPVTGRLP